MGEWSPTRWSTVTRATLERTQTRKGERMLDLRDNQLMLGLTRNGWPTTAVGSVLGSDADKGYVMVYTHLIHMGVDAMC